MSRTALVFQRDGFLTTLSTTITAVKSVTSLAEDERALYKQAHDDQHVVFTSATIFHPQGGGQPSDEGTIRSPSGTSFNVKNARLHIPTGSVLHFGSFTSSESRFDVDENVEQNIDEEKRLLYSRYHTAGHVLGAATKHLLQNEVTGFEETKASHFPGEAACAFNGLIEGKWKDGIQSQIESFISQDMPIAIEWWDEERFKEEGIERLTPDRRAMGMGEGEKFRVVRIVGAEAYPCGGTHVRSTADVKGTKVKKISRSKGTSRVGYVLD
ncbi:ThrRS/AlaRS common domain-containing protein [Viridothelium virens]|uniref:ThrRS/AlaRS common domain-containing protein n=1 Tax=Viridothelium virens TaxID=1048519 RepID=A0A6A6HA08_VIRVR|nr:ThrRS/AlaRS common domain-containing protein [Viridothelium virens]